jgi:hypothetical protein
VRDIYVEGPTDRAFVFGILRRLGIDGVQVREVDVVDVTSDCLRSFGLGSGNRQRVIALALALENAATTDLSRQVVCIADADDEAGHDPKITGAFLIYTDTSTMVSYAFAASYIQWYLDVVVLGFPISGDTVIDTLSPILRILAVARRAFHSLGLNCAPVDVIKDCALTGLTIEFDSQRFLTRYLDKASARERRGDVEAEMVNQATSLPADARQWVNDEDFTGLLHWFVVRVKGSKNTVAENLLGRTLLLGIPSGDVLEWRMFRQVMDRVGNNTKAPQTDAAGEARFHKQGSKGAELKT